MCPCVRACACVCVRASVRVHEREGGGGREGRALIKDITAYTGCACT